MFRDERGQVALFVIGMTLVCLSVVGVAVDGTRAFLHRRTLQNAADSAVLAAASEIDRSNLYRGSGSVRLAVPAAASTVEASLRERGLTVMSSLEADERNVSVLLRSAVPTSFLRLIGIDELPIAVQAAARPMP